MAAQDKNRSPWTWVPTLYFYQGIPYSIVMITSGLIYKTMGISIASFAFWTSLLYLPWAVKPLWSPYIDVVSTKRNWVVWTQLLLALAFIGAGMAMPVKFFYPVTIAIFALIAVSSASHDIAADGFYMYALDQHKQAFFVGIRSTFYRFAMLTALGLVPLVAGLIQKNTGLEPVPFEARSVRADLFTQFDPSAISITPAAGEPKILLYPLTYQCLSMRQGNQSSTQLSFMLRSQHLLRRGRLLLSTWHERVAARILTFQRARPAGLNSTAENWNVPAALSLKTHHNLTTETKSEFNITAGNIAFSWTVSLAVLGLVLLLLAFYNRFALPHPDEHSTKEKVGWKVYKEVFVSFFTKPGIIPALIFFLLYRLGEAQLVKVATPFLVDSRSAGGIGLTSAQYGIAYGTVGMLCLTAGGILGGIVASKFGLKKLIWFMALAMNIPISVYIFLSYHPADAG